MEECGGIRQPPQAGIRGHGFIAPLGSDALGSVDRRGRHVMSVATSISPRTFLILGRVSNLPTVWSNCLCGWWLSGGGQWGSFLVLCLGASLLYVGGMYLNDAFDADFDRARRSNRPIPQGLISERLVWMAGVCQLAAGWALVASLGKGPAVWGLALVGAILVYDAVHKAVSFAPVLMALCRVFLVILAGATGDMGVSGLGVWSAVVLGCWIVGLSYLARRESDAHALVRFWPVLALAAPLLLAVLANPGPTQARAWIIGLLLAAWAWRCIRFTFPPPGTQRNIVKTVSGLLAGICLVDLLAVAPGFGLGLAFVSLFAASLLFQRYVPAT